MKAIIRLIFPILILLVFATACQEGIVDPPIINEEKFSLAQFDEAIQQNLEILYDNGQEASLLDEEGKAKETWIEYPSNFKSYITIEDSAGFSEEIFFTLLERTADDGEVSLTLLKFVPAIVLEEDLPYSYMQLADFSGTIYCYDESAVAHYAIGVTNGRVVSSTSNYRGGHSALKMAPIADDPCFLDINIPCSWSGGAGASGSWQWQGTQVYTDWWQSACVGIVCEWNYLGSSTSTRWEQVWVPGNGRPNSGRHEHIGRGEGGTGGGGSGSNFPKGPHPNGYLKSEAELWEEEIDDSKLNPCMQDVLDKLKSIAPGIGTFIMQLDNSADYKWYLKNKSIKDGYAYTEWDLTRDASVSYFDDKQLANATDIGLACLILHESYHAYLHYKYRNYSIDPSYECLFEYNYSEKEEHEKWVEDDFIAAMASTLYTFGTSKGYPYTIEFYKKNCLGRIKRHRCL
jgi:hypothetical protein